MKDRNKLCAFHNDYGHTTTRCENLYGKIKVLMRKGKLIEYLKEPSIHRVNTIYRNRKEHQTNQVGTSQQVETTSFKVISHVSRSLEENSTMYKEYMQKKQKREITKLKC